MKISTNLILGSLTFFGGALAILGKTRTTRTVGIGVGVIAGSSLLSKMYREESKKIETQCQKTEEVFETTGLDPEKLETSALLTGTEEEIPVFAEIILREARNSLILSDESLEYDRDAYLNTLHVMQNVDKNRIIISIPLPPKTKGNLGTKEIRDHYKQIFDDFIAENKLDMKNYLNQIGVVVTKDNSDQPYTYYEEILRDEDESFQEYITRVISYQRDSHPGKAPKGLSIDDNDTFMRIEQYLNLEFPVFPVHSNKKGLDIFSATKLIKILTEPAYIKSAQTGREVVFDLNHVAFHPTDDYGEILVSKGGSIVSIEI